MKKCSALEPKIKGDSRRGESDLHRNGTGVIFFFMYVSDNHELS